MNNLDIIPMKLEDVQKIIALENSHNIHILSEEIVNNDLKSGTVRYFLLKQNERVIGYIAFGYVLENMDIHSVVIDKEYEHHGYGSYLIDFVFDFAKNNNVSNIFLEVRISNFKAIKMYEKKGFKKINIRKNYYPDNHEDAIIYKYTLNAN